MRHRHHTIALLLGLTALVAMSTAASGQTLVKPRLLFGGYYRPSGWVYSQVTVRNMDKEFRGSLVVEGVGRTAFAKKVIMPAPSIQTYILPVLVHAAVPDLLLRLKDEGGTTRAESRLPAPVPLGKTDLFVGFLGGENPQRWLQDRNVWGTPLEAADLPTRQSDFHVFNCILVASLPEDVDARRLGALAAWVRAGGHLVVSNWRLLYGPRSSPLLKAFFPDFSDNGPINPTALLRSWGRWNHQAEMAERLGIVPTETRFIDDDTLLYLRSPVGSGRITILGLNPGQDPVRSWSFEKKRRVWETVLLDRSPSASTNPALRGVACVDDAPFSYFEPPRWSPTTFRTTGAWIVAYGTGAFFLCLALGAFFTRKPILVVGALLLGLVGAGVTGAACLPDRHASSETLTLVDLESGASSGRVERFIHVSSVRGGSVAFSVANVPALHPVAFNLHLLRTTEMSYLAEWNRTSVEGLSLPPAVRFLFRSEEEVGDLGRISVTFERGRTVRATVLSRFQGPLRDCHLLRRGLAFPMGTVEPGDTRSIGLEHGAGRPVGQLLFQLDQGGRQRERRILAAFLSGQVRSGETVFLGFADGLAAPVVQSDSFQTTSVLPTLVVARIK